MSPLQRLPRGGVLAQLVQYGSIDRQRLEEIGTLPERGLQFRLERVIAVETVRLRVGYYAGVLRIGSQHEEARAVGRTPINIPDGTDR